MARRTWHDTPATDTPISASMLNDLEARKPEVEYTSLNVKDFGALGDGVHDDTPNINAALAALPLAPPGKGNAVGGIVFMPAGQYRVTGPIAITYCQHLVGEGFGEYLQAFGATTIKSEYNGPAITVGTGRYGWGLHDLSITGDRSLTSQDLLVIGTTGVGVIVSEHGVLERLYVSQAGRDCVQLNNALHVHADACYFHKAVRNCLRVSGQSNSNKFTKCNFREADQWGVWWGGGYGGHFDACTIESNSRHATVSYGGLSVDPNDPDTAADISLQLSSTHFEANSGVAGAGNPLQVLTGTRACSVSEVNNLYVDTVLTRTCPIAKGEFTSIGVQTNLTTHATITSAQPAVFVNPRKIGSGNFTITDSSNIAVVIGATTTLGAAGTEFRWSDASVYRGGAATVRTRGQWSSQRANLTDVAFGSLTDPDGVERHLVHASGKHFWGGGASLDVSLERTAANRLELQTADLAILTAGRGLRVGEGTNAKMGVSTLAAGTVTVSNTSVTANSRIFLTCQTPGGTPGFLRVSARTAGTSFTILSSSASDTSVVAWFIAEPA